MIGMNTFGNTVTRDEQQKQLSFWNSTALGFTLDGDNPQQGYVKVMAKQADGKIIVSGSFSKYNGVTVKEIVRLNANLTLDTSFDPVGAGVNDPAHIRYGLLLTEVQKIYPLSDGRIILTYRSGGRRRPYINSPATHGLQRDNVHPGFVVLSSDGSLDSSHATYRKTFIDEWVAATYQPGYHLTPGNTNWGMWTEVSLVKNDEFLIQSYQQPTILHFTTTGTKKVIYPVGSSYYAVAYIADIELDSTEKLWAVGRLQYKEEDYDVPHPTSYNTPGFESKEDQALQGHFGGVWAWNSNGTRNNTFRGGFYLGPNVNTDYPTGLNIDSNDNLILIVARRPGSSRYIPTIKNNGSDPAVNINDYNTTSHPSLFTVKQDGSPVGTITNSAIVNDPLDWTSALQGLNARSEILRLDNGSWAIGDDAARAGMSVFMPDTKTHHQTLVVIDSSGNTNANINGRASRSQTEPESNFLHGVIGDPLNYVNTGIFSIVQLDNDSILVGGKFSSYDGVDRNMIMQFNITTGEIESPATY
tara:strand:+ start:1005 stop:2588 length:1584 start_codon:yes stop_codon:yes gene_type:complete